MAIGVGSFGLVWQATVKSGPHKGELVAIKVIDMVQFNESNISEIRKEIAILSDSRHKNIVSELASFIDGNFLWLVMPLLDAGSVLDVLKHKLKATGVKGIQDESVIATILKETLDGLQYVHSNAQIHRDIKAGNILLNKSGQILLSDFGVSATLKKGQKRDTFVGSPCWMAPEVME